MRLSLSSFAIVVLQSTGVLFGCYLSDGDHVKETIQLAIAASIHPDSDVTAARARHGGGSALGGERSRVAVIAEIASVTDQPCSDHVRYAMHRRELRADLRGQDLQLTFCQTDLCRQPKDLLRGVLQVVDKGAGCGV